MAITQNHGLKRDTTDAFGWMLDPILPLKRQRRSSSIKRAPPTPDIPPADETEGLGSRLAEEECLELTPSLINARRTYSALVAARKIRGGDIVGRVRKVSLHMAAVGTDDVYPHCPKQSVLVKQLVSTGMGCAEVGELVAQLPVFAFSELVHYFSECGGPSIPCRILGGVLVNGRQLYDLEELADRKPHRAVGLRRICAMEAPS